MLISFILPACVGFFLKKLFPSVIASVAGFKIDYFLTRLYVVMAKFNGSKNQTNLEFITEIEALPVYHHTDLSFITFQVYFKLVESNRMSSFLYTRFLLHNRLGKKINK